MHRWKDLTYSLDFQKCINDLRGQYSSLRDLIPSPQTLLDLGLPPHLLNLLNFRTLLCDYYVITM